VPARLGSLSHRDDFGVGGGVLVSLAAVSAPAEHASRLVDDDAADRHVARGAGNVGFGERELHEGFGIKNWQGFGSVDNL
jgi:hypothetical protein